MTRRISPLPGAIDALFGVAPSDPGVRTRRAEADTWRPERKRRSGGVSPMRRHRFRSAQDVS